MILAAGLGTRLAPITKKIPKPLLPVVGIPNIVRTIGRLRDVGIREIVINTHWLPGVLKSRLGDGCGLGVSIAYSDEPELLGTGGGIRKALSLLGDETFIVVNGDALFAPDFERAVAFHQERGALATLLVREDPDAEKYEAVGLDPSGRIRRLLYGGKNKATLKNRMFTGVHIISPEAASSLPESGCVVRDAYIPMVEDGAPIFGLEMGGYFCDLGTPARYLSANIDLVTGAAGLSNLEAPETGIYFGKGARVDVRAKLGPGTVICDGAAVEGPVFLSRTVVLEGGRVLTDVRNAVVTADGDILPVTFVGSASS
jgi:NDP-sugar pyrophosphorylase family protein